MSYKLDLGLGLQLKKQDVKKVESQLDSLYKKYNNKVLNVDVSKNLSNSFKTLSGGIDSTTKSARESAKVFEKYFEKQTLANRKLTEMPNITKRASKEIKNLSSETDKASKSVMTLGEQFKEGFVKFAVWGLVSTIYVQAIRSVFDMIEAVTELDTALVELKKVTDESSGSIEKLTEDASKVGQEVGRTTAEIIEATSMWARMGYTAREALDLAEQSAILVNIGDGVEDLEQASSSLIATLKGFGLETSKTADILDKLNEISNTYGVTTSDLTTGIEKVSASMSAAGNDLDETLALFTSATEVLRDANRASVALRTISMRLRGVSESGEDLADLIPDLQKYFDAYGTGVKLVDEATGAFNSTYDILDKLSDSWSTLTDLQRANLTELIAGKRQSDTLNAVLANTNTLTSALTTSQNSFGSALKENAIYMESIQAKTKQFESALKDLWTSTIGSEAIKTIVEMATELIQLVDNIGLVNIALSAFISYLITFKGLAIVQAFTSLGTAIMGFVSNVAFGQTVMQAFTASVGASTVALTAFQAVATFGVSLIGVALVSAFAKHNKALKEADDLYKKTKESIDELTSTEAKIRNMTDALVQMKEILDYEEVSKELKRLREDLNQLEEGSSEWAMTKTLIGQYEEQISSVTKAQQDLNNLSAQYRYETSLMKISVDDLNDSVEDVNKTFEDQTDILSSLASEFDNINNSEEVSVETLLELINKYPEYIDYLFKEESLKKGAIKLTEALFEIEKQKSIEILKGKMAELIAEDALMDAERNRLRMLAQAGEISWGEVYDAESNTDEIITLIGAISGLESATVDSFNGISESTSKSTTSTKEYISTITDLTELERELQEIRDEASVRGIDSRQEEIAKIKQIQAELHRLNIEDKDRLSNIEQGTQEYDDLYSTIISRSQKWYDLERDILGINKEITDELEAQAKSSEEIAKQMSEEAKDAQEAINKLIDATVELRKQELENEKESYEVEKDRLSALREEKKLRDELNKKAKKVTDLEEELQILKLDTSEDNNARILEIEEELNDAKFDLNEELEEKKYQEQQDALDDNIDAIDDYLSKEGRLRKDAMDRINASFKNGMSSLMNDLISWNNIYGTSIQGDIVNMWNEAINAVERYSGKISGIKNMNVEETLILAEMAMNSAKWWSASPEERKRLEDINFALGTSIGLTRNEHEGVWYNKEGIRAYATGGVSTEDGLAMIHKNEMILNGSQIGRLFELIKNYNPINSPIPIGRPRTTFPSITPNNSSTFSPSVVVNLNGNTTSGTANTIANRVESTLNNLYNNRGFKNIKTR